MGDPHSFPVWLKWPLRLFSGPYRLTTSIRNTLYDRRWKSVTNIGVPVISVGNLTVGGTGKTPCVEWLATRLRDDGHSVCLLSRGYGADESGLNDEAMLLEENLPDVPHLQNPDRIASARTAIDELEAEILILDDGFQHRRLHRNFDLVLIDATQPPQSDWCLPGGTLRESATAGIRRADAIMLTRCDQADNLEQMIEWLRTKVRPGTPIVETEHRPIEPTTMTGQSVAMVCGIGNPAAFRKTLAALGATVIAERIFPDHHRYSRNDVESLQNWAATLLPNTVIAVTQKDHVKLRLTELAGRVVVPVRIGLTFRCGEEELIERIRQAIQVPGD